MGNSRLYKAQTRFLFHAHIKIKISVFYDDSVFDELYAVLENVDRLYNSYQSGSYIDRINKNAGRYVEVDDETIGILKTVKDLSDCFDGEYDITIMPLIRLWGFYKEKGRKIPSAREIEETKKRVDYRRIELDGNRVRIDKDQEIITGSFIKAYAVDKLVARMKSMGITDAIINAGGSTIYAIGDDTHRAWQIVVRHPDTDKVLYGLNIGNCCYSTSSQTKTYVEIDGRRYGHILSAKTGFPSANKQIGIVSDSCMVGDIVSTGLYNLKGLDFVQKAEAVSALYPIAGFAMDESGRIVTTTGFDRYIIKG